jgi:hypothetical protein
VPHLHCSKGYSEKLEKEVIGKVDKLAEVGWEEYVVKKSLQIEDR